MSAVSTREILTAPLTAATRPDEMVAVLDFGAQYSQLIARRIREAHVYCEILSHETPVAELKAMGLKGIVMSGGPRSVYEPGAMRVDPKVFSLGVPILGICYGMQLLARELGGVVRGGEQREYGKTELEVLDGSDLFRGLNPSLICWMSHGDLVEEAPPGFTVTARTANTPVAAMSDRARGLYGVQFHPEVVHTPWGSDLIHSFLKDGCGCQGLWTMESFVSDTIDVIREGVGGAQVVCGLSGGIDSATTAALVSKAVGDQLYCIFVDHGLMRKGEPSEVTSTFRDRYESHLIPIDATDRFLRALRGVTDPEAKRRIIGNEFVAVFEEEARKIGEVEFLAQGTLYPDVIESGTGSAAVIKTHHNVGGLPEKMNLRLIEPLRNLFKDEAREVARQLGLPESITWRQPFPGPGLAIRVLGEISKERIDILREADFIVLDEIVKAGWYRRLWQAFAVLPNVQSVGVMGDQRTYTDTIIVRAVTSNDGMTADWARLPYEALERISSRIINEVPGVNRVAYDISSKPPATIEWE